MGMGDLEGPASPNLRQVARVELLVIMVSCALYNAD